MRHDLPTWQRAVQDQLLLDAVSEIPNVEKPSPSELARLRRTAGAEEVEVALELTSARRRGREKFARADALIADRAGVEQASGDLAAEHKARRFAAVGVDGVFDLCCGIGGDAMALVRGCPVVAIDRDPVRAWMAGRNAGCESEVRDVADWSPTGAFHIDPGRRAEGGTRQRLWQLEDLQPGIDTLRRLAASDHAGAIKLGPGADLDVLDELGEVELLGGKRGLLQAIVWSGRLATSGHRRTATALHRGLSFGGDPDVELPYAVGEARGYLLVPDPALERAGLVGARLESEGHDAAEWIGGLGYLGADAPGEDPWLTPFEVDAVLPWREKRVAQHLQAAGAGVVTVRTRGGATDANQAAKRLRGSGDRPATVFVYRRGKRVEAVVTWPVGAD